MNMMEGDSSLSCNKSDKKKKKKKKEKGHFQGVDFTDRVFLWSLEDIFNEDLYKYQVEKIPLSFESIEQYFRSYIYPLLEETRADLASSMQIMHRAPFAEIITFGEAKPYGESLYEITVDTWRNRYSDRGKEPYRTLPGDFFILSDGKPDAASDLQRPDRTWTFATVTKISDARNADDNATCVNFKIKMSKKIAVQDGRQKSLFVVFVANLTTNRRIWKSLNMRRNLEIVKHVLSIDSEVETISIMPSHTCDISQLSQTFNLDLLSELNDSQRDAILASLDKVQGLNKSPVELIWGPPGTGKTKTISVLLFILLKMNCRTLICAPTNVAITQVASRLLSLMKESFEAANDGPFCSFGDVLLFGNKERLRIGSDVKEIYLEHRVQRLIECLGPLTGWRHCISSMIQFLEECVPQYRVFVENESIKKKENSGENEFGKMEIKSFLEYVRDRFRCTARPLKTCIVTFCTHLPRSFMKDDNLKNMVHLYHLLDSLESMLFQRNLVSEELEALFSHDEMITDSVVLMENSSLNSLRTESISILKALRPSLEKLGLPSAMSGKSVERFCFQRATHVFCTASTSFKLHSVEMEPLNFLVIDEAAQLKECESNIPLQLAGIKHAIFIGDERQLPAMVKSNVSAEAHFGRSVFERLSLLGHSKHMLNVQYRMHPSLNFFPNRKFYQSQIFDAENVTCKNYKKQYLPGPMFGPYSFINIVGGREEVDDVGHSRRNLVEVAVVVKILQCLYRAWRTSKKKFTIGVISPYAAQVVSIKDRLGKKYDNIDEFSLKVKSIDGFQGGEEDIIIISTVRSNIGGSIGFMSNPQRTNVALTRARHCLWILGNDKTLARSESLWEELVTDAKNRQCFFDAGEDDCLRKAVIDVKKELDEFDDLLNGNNLLYKNAKWKVHFSDNFRKSFGKLKSSRMKKSVLNLLLRLSTGWRPKNRSVDTICEHSSQITKQFKVEGFYIVCTIDIVKIHYYIQVLKVWDVLPLEEIPKLIKRLDSIFTSYTGNFINCCKEKCFEGNLEVPKIWAASNEIIRFKNRSNSELGDEGSSTDDGRNYIENSKVRESLMKFYPLSSSVVNHLLSDHDGRELELLHEVIDDQMDIILFGKSSFVLGRSGTGKTTILTKKLFQREEIHHSISEQIFAVDREHKSSVLRQLFVTVSPKLCYAVKRYISNMKSFACGGNFSIENSSIDFEEADTCSEFNDIPDSFVSIPVKKYPLVITFHKFLMMLDGTLGSSYFERFPDVRELSLDPSTSSRSVALRTFLRTKEVDYDCFCSYYWSHFNTRHTKKLEPSKVFAEIMSHIKGGNQAGESRDGKMSRDKYILLCEGRISTLTRQMREIVYDIYQDYERMKTERGEYDICDLVCDIHRRLGNHKYGGDKMDFVYIDEVQDLTMRQICLFKYICPNIEGGFVFAGDTAQTIARGIDFRFEDVRSLFYNEFIGDRLHGRKEKGLISETLHLKQNFRTHAGVLNLAQSVIQILYHFFPHSIDILPPETSDICGEAPVLLESGNDENAIVTIFGNNGTGDDIVGFGAEQVILVRDDVARMEISKYVGKNALVLTILECKGLEFQDVLLYNFFGSSPLENKWRVIYKYMEEQELLDNTPSPSFSLAKHNGLCSELKQLYVAITRTRQRLWICENIRDLSSPMFDYWKGKNIVQVRKLDDSLVQAMQVASSPEEWKKRGIKLFEERNYEMAILCFERAGDVIWEKLAKASGLRTSAQRMRGSNPEDARNYLGEAAEMFESVGKSHSAASCYYDLEEYEKAGRIYQEKCGDLEMAAQCFTRAGCYEIAAEIYAKGNYFSECLCVCTKGNLFELGLQYIEYWKQHKEVDKLQQKFLESCAQNYYERKDSRSMMKFVRAFCSMDSKRSFLKSLDCLEELLLLEEESENFANAAEIARLKGYVLKDADLLGIPNAKAEFDMGDGREGAREGENDEEGKSSALLGSVASENETADKNQDAEMKGKGNNKPIKGREKNIWKKKSGNPTAKAERDKGDGCEGAREGENDEEGKSSALLGSVTSENETAGKNQDAEKKGNRNNPTAKADCDKGDGREGAREGEDDEEGKSSALLGSVASENETAGKNQGAEKKGKGNNKPIKGREKSIWKKKSGNPTAKAERDKGDGCEGGREGEDDEEGKSSALLGSVASENETAGKNQGAEKKGKGNNKPIKGREKSIWKKKSGNPTAKAERDKGDGCEGAREGENDEEGKSSALLGSVASENETAGKNQDAEKKGNRNNPTAKADCDKVDGREGAREGEDDEEGKSSALLGSVASENETAGKNQGAEKKGKGNNKPIKGREKSIWKKKSGNPTAKAERDKVDGCEGAREGENDEEGKSSALLGSVASENETAGKNQDAEKKGNRNNPTAKADCDKGDGCEGSREGEDDEEGKSSALLGSVASENETADKNQDAEMKDKGNNKPNKGRKKSKGKKKSVNPTAKAECDEVDGCEEAREGENDEEGKSSALLGYVASENETAGKNQDAEKKANRNNPTAKADYDNGDGREGAREGEDDEEGKSSALLGSVASENETAGKNQGAEKKGNRNNPTAKADCDKGDGCEGAREGEDDEEGKSSALLGSFASENETADKNQDAEMKDKGNNKPNKGRKKSKGKKKSGNLTAKAECDKVDGCEEAREGENDEEGKSSALLGYVASENETTGKNQDAEKKGNRNNPTAKADCDNGDGREGSREGEDDEEGKSSALLGSVASENETAGKNQGAEKKGNRNNPTAKADCDKGDGCEGAREGEDDEEGKSSALLGSVASENETADKNQDAEMKDKGNNKPNKGRKKSKGKKKSGNPTAKAECDKVDGCEDAREGENDEEGKSSPLLGYVASENETAGKNQDAEKKGNRNNPTAKADEVIDDQMDIIFFGKSSFVLGQSGTGKTTILTKKLFQREEIHHSFSEQIFAVDREHKSSVLRQLFVTVSPKLCYAVKRYISNMKSFACGGNFSIENSSIDFEEADTCSEFNDIPDSFVSIPVKKYPLVITFHKFLMMLDGTLGSSYFERFPDVRELSLDPSTSSRSVALRTFLRTKEVDYDCFCSYYWSHFNTRHTKKLEPSKVFAEIMSHIKGGNQAGESRDGKMSRDKYILLCEGRVSTLTRQMREIVYDIYQDYERMKTERGEYDLCDLVCDIHRRFGNHKYGGDKMDFVYIDEVQDLTMRQICLFKYICPNIEGGFVFAGDTAQTIARGIDFRFEDVRSFFYNEFIGDRLHGRKEKGLISETLHLKQNFRTHAGVLNLAQSVIQILYHFFPHSIDILPAETSDICGEAPVLLESGNDENAIVTIFGNNGTGDDIVGFGAEQVILVRDDVARMEISKYVGKNALVLTILECKGLEFQDVLLYNFFGSSPLENKWRVIYKYMEEQELLDNTPSPSFSLAKHNGLCSELKQLYVAITRTRQRLWICENIRDLSAPMFDYWKGKNIVQVRKLDDSLVQAMQVASSPEEWKKRGIKLFEERNYEMAILCFERAGDVIWEKLAKASSLRTSAQRMRGSNPEDARNYLRDAAEMFESVGKSHSAASCYYDLEEYEKAGRIYQEECGDLEMAAQCFTRAGCYEIAAEVYAKGNYFSECLCVCTKGNLFELGLQYIEYWKQHKEVDKLQQKFLESCAQNYYERKDSHSMMKFVRAFCSMDLKRSFLKSLDCLEELLLLEEESENFANAAEIARLKGYVLKDADLLGNPNAKAEFDKGDGREGAREGENDEEGKSSALMGSVASENETADKNQDAEMKGKGNNKPNKGRKKSKGKKKSGNPTAKAECDKGDGHEGAREGENDEEGKSSALLGSVASENETAGKNQDAEKKGNRNNPTAKADCDKGDGCEGDREGEDDEEGKSSALLGSVASENETADKNQDAEMKDKGNNKPNKGRKKSKGKKKSGNLTAKAECDKVDGCEEAREGENDEDGKSSALLGYVASENETAGKNQDAEKKGNRNNPTAKADCDNGDGREGAREGEDDVEGKSSALLGSVASENETAGKNQDAEKKGNRNNPTAKADCDKGDGCEGAREGADDEEGKSSALLGSVASEKETADKNQDAEMKDKGNNKPNKGRKKSKGKKKSGNPTAKAECDKVDGCEEAREGENDEEGKSSALLGYVASENETAGKNQDAEKKGNRNNPTTKADCDKGDGREGAREGEDDEEGKSSALLGSVASGNETAGKNQGAEKKGKGNNKPNKGCEKSIGKKKCGNPTAKPECDKGNGREGAREGENDEEGKSSALLSSVVSENESAIR